MTSRSWPSPQDDALRRHIGARNPAGIPSDEPVQLFLWLFVTTRIVPEDLSELLLTKEYLASTFDALTADGIVGS